jgi:hypothetical protein
MLAMTVPLYLDVLDALGIWPYVVFPVRHPAEVIRSIGDRNDLDPATIEFLWLRHVLEAEKASRTCRRVWTSYEGLLESWAPTVQSIASRLEITWPNEHDKVRPTIEKFLRPRHRHYRVDKDPISSAFGPSSNPRLGSSSAWPGRERDGRANDLR